MHLFPAAAELLPDPRLAAAGSDRITVDEFLRQAGVAHHHRFIAQPAQMWASHHSLPSLSLLTLQ